MKFALIALLSLCFVSCNTAIGMYRDVKQGVIWSKNKIQESRNGGGGDYQSDPYGAPTY